jgi:alanine racemase
VLKFPRALIDAAALRHNLAVVRRTAPRARVLAVVKANAYGHGLVPAARALTAADAFGVARLGEGVALRAAGIANPVVLLEGVFSTEQLEVAAREQFEIVVHSPEQLALLEQGRVTRQFTVWLKCDTGMNRLGFRPGEFNAALARVRSSGHAGEVRVMTHLASAEAEGNAGTQAQLATFDSLVRDLGLERSIANSAGLAAWPEARLEWVRPGLMLYGISPFTARDAGALGLVPAMTFVTQLIAVRRVAAGEAVGYSGIWRASRDSTIGIAAVGYGDGYPRNVVGGAPMLVKGREAQVVGRVSMDMTAVDVTDIEGAAVGDEVIVWGRGLPIERIAPYCSTIAYELVCGISDRVTAEWI